MLQIISINVYDLLNPGATFSCVTSLVDISFYVLPDILFEPFFVTTLVGISILSKQVFMNYPIYIPNIVTCMDFIELEMVNLI